MPRAKLAKLAIEELKKEIVRRTKVLPKLIAMRDMLDKKISELECLGAAKPAAVVRRKPGRRTANRKVVKPARAGSLGSTLVEALRAKGKWAVAEAAEAAIAAGYRSKSKDFANIVSMTLSKDKRFRRVRRGVYALKG